MRVAYFATAYLHKLRDLLQFQIVTSMQFVLGIISIVFTILGVGLIHLETIEIKKNGYSLASLGFIFFGILWTAGWVVMALEYLF